MTYAVAIKCRRNYLTAGNSRVTPEPVRVLRRAKDIGDGWYIVRYLTGHIGTIAMHASNLGPQVAS